MPRAFGAIVLAGKFFHLRKEEFGFSRNQLPAALRAVFSFLLIWTVIQVSLSVAWIYLLKWEFSLPFNPTLWNTTGRILFQLGFSGPSEELLYRSLNLAVLLYFARKALPNQRMATGLAVALSVVIFMVAHSLLNCVIELSAVLLFVTYPL